MNSPFPLAAATGCPGVAKTERKQDSNSGRSRLRKVLKITISNWSGELEKARNRYDSVRPSSSIQSRG